METLYTGRFHGFPNVTSGYSSSGMPEEGVLSLIVVLATSVSLVALVFAFITYSMKFNVNNVRLSQTSDFIVNNMEKGLPEVWAKFEVTFPNVRLDGDFVANGFFGLEKISGQGKFTLFSDLRNLMGTTLMTLLATTFMAQLIYVVGVGGVHEKGLCLSIAHSLQFLHLCLIAWLTILCRDTLNALDVEQSTLTSKEMCARYTVSCIFGWFAPATAVYFAYSLSTSTNKMVKSNCWFIEKKLHLLTYSFPALILLCACVCLMVRSYVRLKYTLSLETRPKVRAKLSKAKKLQVGLCSKLTATLLTMELSGLGYITTGQTGFWLVYNIMHSIQGLIMALCATCNSQVLSVYTRRHKRRRSTQKLLSKSSSLDELEWSPLPSTV